MKILTEGIRILIAVAIIGCGVGVFQWLGKAPDPPKKDLVRATEGVTTEPISIRAGGMDIDVDGVAVPYREIPVAAEVAGRITQMAGKIRPGKYVEKGDVLLQLDDRDYQFEVDRLNKEIVQAKRSLEELKVEIENADNLYNLAILERNLREKEKKRVVDLKAVKAASVADVDMAERALIQAKNGVAQVSNQRAAIESRRERLEAGVQLKKVQLERATLDLQRATVRAPISGVIVEAPAEEDAYVQRGAPLLTIEDTSRVEIRCQLQLDQLFWLWRLTNQNAAGSQDLNVPLSPSYEIPHAEATVSLTIGDRHNAQTFEWDAELSRFEGIGLDSQTRTMPCRVVVNNPRAARFSGDVKVLDKHIRPPALIRGMFVDVRIKIPFDEDLLGVPDTAIRPGGSVWVYEPAKSGEEDGRLRIEEVDVIRYTSDFTALVRKSELLDDGARVVTTPLIAVEDGMKVRDSAFEEAADKEDGSESDMSVQQEPSKDKDDPA